jgi:hypothetical protein
MVFLLGWMVSCTTAGDSGSPPAPDRETPTLIFSPTTSPMPEATQSLAETATVVVPVETPTLEAMQNKDGSTINSPGLTYEENLAINPPPPDDLAAIVTSGGIKLTWNPPPPVLVTHYYSDNILYYKVYRRVEGASFVFLGQTEENSYLDKTAAEGTRYYYTVTAQHENGIESSRPNEITTLP